MEIPFDNHILQIVDDQKECRKLMSKHGMMSLMAYVKPHSIVSGPLLGDDPKGFLIIHPRGFMRAYLFVQPMPVNEAMDLVVKMAKLLSGVVGLKPQIEQFDDTTN